MTPREAFPAKLLPSATLTVNSYDGDDADTTNAPADPDPEPYPAADEDATKPEPESMPVIAGGSSGGPDTGNEPQQQFGTGDMEGVQDDGDYHDSRAEERPIGIKEDG